MNDGAVTQQQFDQTQTTFDTAIATLQAREAAVNAASEQLRATQVQSTGFNPGIRNAQLEALRRIYATPQISQSIKLARFKNPLA
ncbi:hypothetical protein ANSO36C_14210 [Nostoc cf. commune SO-36]|uniref:Uncharacterized protein n=1 Tax=Nostoc cf. commune SO-36 TaxID=449208 RepID=A0ABN6Q1C3_NOSCO|nr:hypothetical protein [Nostoc commune]BDI15619.1 hypothetical protein ANSO36C_14210 [Nostoc cf. commune SO-36]